MGKYLLLKILYERFLQKNVLASMKIKAFDGIIFFDEVAVS